MPDDLPIKSFKTPDAFREWLEKNHAKSSGLWIRYYKKASGIPSIVYKQALDEVLCFGWIDGQVKSEGEDSYLQRFTPRRPKSNWAKLNREKVEKLIAEGRMRPRGLAEVEKAKTIPTERSISPQMRSITSPAAMIAIGAEYSATSWALSLPKKASVRSEKYATRPRRTTRMLASRRRMSAAATRRPKPARCGRGGWASVTACAT